ncbi:MAG TPA: MarR family transcriptional regulator [Polaromonas sp.]|uniref:MarR family winged helix-turn-helix transcriptional regulator n=1 Tax=Polaromonas sp. TaxID=1869339 RepID=UPI002D23579F|nr:MarR family transcriptional regulator [Polaromonas sp.]HYW55791.1 MarR family transcriptional regulator [Polaromonas sp.]
MPIKDPLRLDEQLCFVLYSTSLAMTKVYKPLLEEIGLTYPQYLVMLVLWEREGITVKALADALYQESGSLTPVLKRMEADGLLLRLRVAGDDRSLALTLTPEGRKLKLKAVKVNKAIETACGMASANLVHLRETVRALHARLVAG